MARRVRGEATRIGFSWPPTLIVAWAAVALTIGHYHHDAWYWSAVQRVGGLGFQRFCSVYGFNFPFLLQVVASILLLVAMRQPLRSYGLGPGDVKAGITTAALFAALYVPAFIIFFLSQGFQDYYGGGQQVTWHAFFCTVAPAMFIGMVRTEFFYRGFLLFGIKNRYGAYPGILVSMVPYVVAHFGKPEIETFGSIPVGFALAYLAVRTNSIWYGVVLHWAIALALAALLFVL